jgi:hypothetical protein
MDRMQRRGHANNQRPIETQAQVENTIARAGRAIVDARAAIVRSTALSDRIDLLLFGAVRRRRRY